MPTNYLSKKEFFASANGYGGFRSYFDKIFVSREFERIFVLKGGPGTGKSTLMKKVVDTLKNKELRIELFRCSSDKNSLDGVIANDGTRKVAIIDGTAPHERDAVIPGAVDVIVNLGEAIDSKFLTEHRNRIFKLNDLKRNSYLNAYQKLAKSAVFDNNIEAEIVYYIKEENVIAKCDDIISSVLNIISSVNKSDGIRLISSFSKDGYLSNQSFEESLSNCFTVSGEYGLDLIFMTILAKRIQAAGIPYVKLVSPLDEKKVEGIFFVESNTAIICKNGGNQICDAREYLSVNEKSAFFEKLKALEKCKKIYESEAQNELIIASQSHFELEEIYTRAVNFDIVNAHTERIIDYIIKIFI